MWISFHAKLSVIDHGKIDLTESSLKAGFFDIIDKIRVMDIMFQVLSGHITPRKLIPMNRLIEIFLEKILLLLTKLKFRKVILLLEHL